MKSQALGRTASEYEEVIAANIEVHSKLAADYSHAEPHFKPENRAKVRRKIEAIVPAGRKGRMLDLGCGTGFMIGICRDLFSEIHGVDVTQAMLDQVDKSGPAKIQLFKHDTGTYKENAGTYDVVTAYSFLHHLFDIGPTLETAFRALKPGGVFFCDLDPNYDFWNSLSALDPKDTMAELVKIEMEKVKFQEHEQAVQLGVKPETLGKAEYGKSIRGGFQGRELEAQLRKIGFSSVQVNYEWFLGEGQVIHAPGIGIEEGLKRSQIVNDALKLSMPLSRCLFKYLGFVARK
jgi:ubiquinone/menaquinone biosynthesis C-methylase UbiE